MKELNELEKKSINGGAISLKSVWNGAKHVLNYVEDMLISLGQPLKLF
jgi:hypothetical protein